MPPFREAESSNEREALLLMTGLGAAAWSHHASGLIFIQLSSWPATSSFNTITAIFCNRDGKSTLWFALLMETTGTLDWQEAMASLAKDSGGGWGASNVPHPQEAVTQQTDSHLNSRGNCAY